MKKTQLCSYPSCRSDAADVSCTKCGYRYCPGHLDVYRVGHGMMQLICEECVEDDKGRD